MLNWLTFHFPKAFPADGSALAKVQTLLTFSNWKLMIFGLVLILDGALPSDGATPLATVEARIRGRRTDARQRAERSSRPFCVHSILSQRPMSLLQIENLSMRFGGLTAVAKLDLEVPEGAIFSVIGPNGAGKTTVFNAITSIYEPTIGEIRFAGHPLRRPLRWQTVALCIAIGICTSLGTALASLDVDQLWRATIDRNMQDRAVAFSPAAAWNGLSGYLHGRLATEPPQRKKLGGRPLERRAAVAGQRAHESRGRTVGSRARRRRLGQNIAGIVTAAAAWRSRDCRRRAARGAGSCARRTNSTGFAGAALRFGDRHGGHRGRLEPLAADARRDCRRRDCPDVSKHSAVYEHDCIGKRASGHGSSTRPAACGERLWLLSSGFSWVVRWHGCCCPRSGRTAPRRSTRS